MRDQEKHHRDSIGALPTEPAPTAERSPRPLPRPSAESASRGADPRGRHADSPTEIPKLGWKDVLLRVKQRVARENLSLIAAGCAFYFMLSIFPGLLAMASIYGIVVDPATLGEHIHKLMAVAPREAAAIIDSQLKDLAAGSTGGLGASAVIGILLALWSASKGAKALIAGLDVAYAESEKRGMVKLQAMALVFTIGFVLFIGASLAVITAVPHLLGWLHVGAAAKVLAYALTWLLLVALLLVGLAALYRYAPSRDNARWRWVSVGSAVAAVLWIVASLGFSWYSAHFGKMNETYGTLAGGILLLLWLQITAFVTLIGGTLNAELEHQTAVDSTVGPPRPLGERGAVMADTVGEATAGKDGKSKGKAAEHRPRKERVGPRDERGSRQPS